MSLRARLLVGMGIIAIVLVSAAAFVTRMTESRLMDQVDSSLRSSRPDFGNELPFSESGYPGRGFSTVYSYVYRASDSTLIQMTAPNLGDVDQSPPDPEAIVAAVLDDDDEPHTVDAAEGDGRYRLLVKEVEVRPPNTSRVVRAPFAVATSLHDVDDSVQRLQRVTIASSGAALVVLALVSWWVLRLGVRPIKQMTTTAGKIADGDLSQRVAESASGTEAAALGRALNTMLGTIEASFEDRDRTEAKLRQFAADASHELRTPVQTIRGYSELYRIGALGEPARLDDAMRRTEQEAVRMGSIIEDLLLLARLDQGRPMTSARVDLASLARDAAMDAGAVEPDRPVTARVDGEVPVLGDEQRLRQVLGNLVTNAMVHTPPGTAITVVARREGADAVIEVHDAGPGMAPDVAAQVFERFYRADPARSRHHGGSGLGLSIVRSVVEAHGGQVDLQTAPGEGTTVTVRLPSEADGTHPAWAPPEGLPGPEVGEAALVDPPG